MPLLNRVDFTPNDVPTDLSPSDKVYYCAPTGEIFTSYEEYFERRVLLDTEVWSCSVTGKSNMTYEEAIDSEEACRNLLKSVDKTLSRAILYLFSKAPGRNLGTSAKTVSTEILETLKEKFMIGEVVLHQRRRHKIRAVHKSSKVAKKDSDEENKSPEANKRTFQYTIELEGDASAAEKKVSATELKRSSTLSFIKVINYLVKVNGIRSETNKSWSVSPRAAKKYQLSEFDWLEHFPVDPAEPKFEVIIPKEIKKRSAPLTEQNAKKESKPKETKKKLSEVEKARLEAERIARKQAELENARKEFKARLLEWKKLKPDETLDDFLQFIIPPPTPIKSKAIPPELIGDCLQVIEFHRTFSNAFGEMQFGSHLRSLTLGDMEEVLNSHSSNGIFCDMLFFFVQALRYCQENEINEAEVSPGTFPFNVPWRKRLVENEESEEEEANDDCEIVAEINADGEEMEVDENEDELNWPVGDACSPEDCVSRSTKAVLWSVKCLGRSVATCQVDECTITEVLRATILTTAAEMIQPITSYRKTVRGYWDNEEEPLILSLSEPLAVETLTHMETLSVFDCTALQKLWLLKLLIDIVLCQADGRQVVDDAEDEIRLANKHIVESRKSEQQRKREYNEKLKELELKAKEAESEPVEVMMVSSTRNKPKKVKLTPQEELDEFKNEQEQLKEAQEQQTVKLNEKILKLGLHIRAQLLGVDRFQRRYWLMAGCPGILVEVPGQSRLPAMADGRQWESFEMPKQVPKPKLSSIKAEVDSDDEPLAGLIKPKVEEKIEVKEEEKEDKKVDTEWATRPTLTEGTSWFNYATQGDVEALVEGLNERGVRERELKTRIEKYACVMNFAPASKATKFFDPSESASEVTTEFESTVSNELQLRDYLLDLEERIFKSDFGDAFEDENERELWRQYWTKGKLVPKGDDDGGAIAIDFYDKIKDELPRRLPLPIHLSPRQPEPEVRNLAASLLLLKRALKKDILCRPMGFSPKKKRNKKKEGSCWRNILCMNDKSWEMSLMTAVSASSVYLHIIHLDECINWDKSPENIRCAVCRKKTDPDQMLICDECETAYHTYCHSPVVKRIPKGDWFCKKCVIKQKQKSSPVKKRRRTQADEDDLIDPMLISDRPRKRKKVNYAE